jgi:hypothetical protein
MYSEGNAWYLEGRILIRFKRYLEQLACADLELPSSCLGYITTRIWPHANFHLQGQFVFCLWTLPRTGCRTCSDRVLRSTAPNPEKSKGFTYAKWMCNGEVVSVHAFTCFTYEIIQDLKVILYWSFHCKISCEFDFGPLQFDVNSYHYMTLKPYFINFQQKWRTIERNWHLISNICLIHIHKFHINHSHSAVYYIWLIPFKKEWPETKYTHFIIH